MFLALSFQSRLDSFVQLIGVLVLFVLILGITYFVTRYIGGIQKEKLSNANIKVLETVRVSNTKYLQIIKIGDKCFCIAVCKDTITYLCEINEESLVIGANINNNQKNSIDSFKAILEKYKKQKSDDISRDESDKKSDDKAD